MFKCTGICSVCGRCSSSELISEANKRKTDMFVYPKDFVPDKNRNGLGIAFDVGTTTVVGMLWDLAEGRMLEAMAESNPQNRFGMDVISRLTYCKGNNENFRILRQEAIQCLNRLINQLCEKNGKDKSLISEVTICGNTTMSHIIAGYSTDSLASAPFVPAYSGMLQLDVSELGLEIGSTSKVYLLPNIAGHVGGDITAGAAAARVLEEGSLTLYIDIGTNGEIILTDGSCSYACSTAAGPAFEGASILHGMRAADGAIEKVSIENGEVFLKAIGGSLPQGICGSGLIDAVAQMLDNGLINKRGRLISAEDAAKRDMPDGLIERLTEENGKRRFVLAARDGAEDIVITQNDIREVQLAKGAVAAGIQLMLDEMGKTTEDIRRVIVAGAFGSHIDKRSAVRIGLLPDVAEEKILSVGNAAGTGVSMALMSRAELEKVRTLPEHIQHVDLASKERFQIIYMEAMAFV